MVIHAGIYGFCLFKQKRWVRADVSVNTKMYGLKPAAAKDISKEEDNNSLTPSSITFQLKTVWMSSSDCFRMTTTPRNVAGWGCFETVERKHGSTVCLFMGGDAQLLNSVINKRHGQKAFSKLLLCLVGLLQQLLCRL